MADERPRQDPPPGSRDEYRRLFEDSRDAIYIGTVDGRLLDVNPSGVKLFGYDSKEEMLALDIAADLYWNPDDRQRAHALFFSQGFLEDLEIELKTRSGQRLWVRETASAIVDAAGEITGFRGILRDVTEYRRLEEQLRQAQKMEAVGRLSEGVAHDFNNLLTAINGYSELALLQVAEDHPLYAGLAEIRKAGQRAADLTRRLLTMSRHQAALPRRLELNRILADMEKLLRRVLGEDVELVTLLDPELHAIHADPGQIEQLLLNLAINAREAMPDGGRLTFETANGSPSTRAGQSPRIPENPVQLVVRDTGEGMSEETRERAFEPLFTTKDQGNVGLGLTVVARIVRQCGGHMELESEAGSGTVLRVYFPAGDSPAAAAVTAAVDAPAGLPRGDETVLLVEDEAAVRDLVQSILKGQGYRVLAARDAKTAIELCDGLDGRLDLLLTDIVMPETSGPRLAEQLQQRYPDLRVLFMSGYTASNTGIRLLHEKRAAFLPKPFSPDTLARKVRAVLDAPAPVARA